ATAIVFQDEEICYRDLNLRAGKMESHLRALGVGPDVPVGICLERSPDMVAAMLGVLKAGGAYVPLDPNYPADRVAFMLENSRAPVLITQRSLRDNLKFQISDLKIVCVEDLENSDKSRAGSDKSRAGIEHPTSNIEHPIKELRSDNLAYVIYTSGSTGVPKGVAIEHRQAVNFIFWARSVFSPEEFSGVLAATSICFDLSIFEIFVTLSCGGKIILAKNALELPSLPHANDVRLINTVPSAIRELLRIGGVPKSVRTVNLAGEPLTAALSDQIYNETSVSRVYDLYGPSETTTYSTYALRQRGGRATIGKPLGNTQVYLVDKNLRPVPIGVPGEIYIGGEGVARGYLHRPDLTGERFIADPFNGVAGARMYKTGDVARWLADGNIEYLGRGDRQVKIRGFRIELDEVESALSQHPSVRECVVLAREDIPGEKRLAAYLVPHPDKAVGIVELRRFLGGSLPEYMVPSAFVMLDAMPLTPNGKINKRALPAPAATREETTEVFADATTPTEEAVATIWRDVLRIEKIGVHDNFFELGGHSLLVTQVMSRVQQTFQVEMTMRQFFDAPTIASLAAAIEEAIVDQVSGMSDEQASRMTDDGVVLIGEPNGHAAVNGHRNGVHIETEQPRMNL
ncbi:MAG TPA: amino acid adenylation domain-containing protein, partial [Desulfuromonadaceae bacterium]|nr:amino acid adenylation domain-containing protein [Desulfuromonadaceae bacterium]